MPLIRIHGLSLLSLLVLAASSPGASAPSWNLREWGGREGLPGEVTALDQAADGMLWVGTTNGAASFDGERFDTVGVREGLEDPEVTALAAAPDGRVWIGTLEGGLAEWHRGQMRIHKEGLPASHVTALLEDQGELWVGTSRGLTRLENTGFATEASPLPAGLGVVALRRSAGGIAADLVDGASWLRGPAGWVRTAPAPVPAGPGLPRTSVIFEGRGGTLWAGVRGRGLLRLVPSKLQYLAIPGPELATVSCLAETADGALWVATDRGQLFRWKDRNDPAPAPVETVGAGRITTLLARPDGELWAGKDDWLIHWPDPGREPVSYSMGTGIRILRNGTGGMLAGLSDGRVVRVEVPADESGPVFSTLSRDPGHREVRALATAPDGSVWAGYFGRLLVIDPQGREREVDFPKAAVSSILPNPDGSAWIGTRGHGWIFIDAAGKSSARRLPADSVAGMARDREGNLWLACRPGLIRLDAEQERSLAGAAARQVPVPVLTTADGLPEEDCSGAIIALQDGRMAVGSGHTVAILGGEVLSGAEDFAPRPRVDRVTGDDQVLDAGTTPLVLGPGTRRVTIRFTSPTPEVSERIHFRYRLHPLEQEWRVTAGDRSATYTGLPPGDHEFQLSCGLAGREWSEPVAGVSFRMEPRFWQTWWWRLLAAAGLLAVAAGGAVLLARRRTRLLTERLRRDRELETERARIAGDLHDTLGAGLTQIGLFIELARNVRPAEKDHHLTRAFQLARQSARSLDEIVWAVNPLNDTLERTLTYLGRFSEEMLSTAGITCQLDFPVDPGKRILSGSQRHHLYLALREALNNVMRHAEASVVRITATTGDDDLLRMHIRDDGRGFHPEEARPDSNGLAGLQRRMAATGGQATIDSQPGKGTTIELTLPLPPDGHP